MKSRKKLLSADVYDAIWSSSAKQAANKYGVDYQDFLAVCHQAGITIPDTKYHLALMSGQDVTDLRVPLPASVGKYLQVQTVKPEVVTDDQSTLDSSDIQHQFSFLNDPAKEQRIATVLVKASQKKNWRTTPEIKAYKASVKQWRNDDQPHHRYNDGYYYDEDQPQPPKFIDSLSPRGMQRACRLLNRIITILKQAGEQVTDDLTIKIGQDEVGYEVKEDQDKVPHKMTSEEKAELADYEKRKQEDDYWVTRPRIRKYDYPYNGHLRIRFTVSGSHRRYVKDGQQSLENQLPKIIAAFYQTYLETKQEREQREAAEQKRKLEEEREQHRKQQIADEKQRVAALINAAKDYQLAAVVRHYAAAVESTAVPEQVVWMQEVADWLDPLVDGTNPYLEKRQHGDSDQKKAAYLGEETTTHNNGLMDYLNML